MPRDKVIVPAQAAVSVQPKTVIQLPFDEISEITVAQSDDELILKNPEGDRVILRDYFTDRAEEDDPILQLREFGPSLTIERNPDANNDTDANLVIKIKDEPSPTGASFNKFVLGEIGDGISIGNLLEPTELELGGYENLEEVDLAGNLGTGDALNGSADIIAPTLTISADDFSLSEGQSTTVYFEFSEDVAGFDVSDVTLTGGLLSNFTQVDGDSWTATFTQDGADPPAVTVADDSYTDLAGNLGTGDSIGGVSVANQSATVSDADIISVANGQITVADVE